MHLQTRGEIIQRDSWKDICPERERWNNLFPSIDQVHMCSAEGETVKKKNSTLYLSILKHAFYKIDSSCMNIRLL